jgi:CelD/BcsL family acetyltransferase involved in cellulose biosynthesis
MADLLSRPHAMAVELVETVEGLQQLESEWQALEAEVGLLPFASWDWSVAWWHSLSRQRLTSCDRLFVLAMRKEGRLAGVAPLMLTERPSRGLRFRCLRYFGVDQNITEVTGPLCAPADEAQFHEALLEYLFDHRDRWDCAILSGLSAAGEAPAIVARYATPVWLDDVVAFVVPLPSSWQAFKATRSRNIKESLRKCANSLRRDALTPTFRVVSEGRELSQALDVFLRLHAARAALRQTVIHENVFRDPASRSFLYALSDRYSAAGKMRIFSMEINGCTVATRLGLVSGRSLYLYYSGYEPAYAKYGVMTHVVAKAIQYAIEHGFETINLSTGKDISKTRWSPAQASYRRVIIGSRSRYAAEAVALYSRLGHFWRTRAQRARRVQLGWARPS